MAAADGKTQLWLAALDRRSAPQRIEVPDGIDEARFISEDELAVRALEADGNHYIERMRLDGSQRRRISPNPIADTDGITPDRKWFVGPHTDRSDPSVLTVVAYAIDGSKSIALCSTCMVGWADSSTMYFDFSEQIVSLPTQPGSVFPALPPGGLNTAKDALKIPGARRVDVMQVHSPAGGHTAFSKHVTLRNLYRIPMM